MPGPLDYIAIGWHIFPCHTITHGKCSCPKGSECVSPGKHPRTQNGVKDASIDPAAIANWQTRYPGTNWGLACGASSNVIVIDADQRKGGMGSLDTLETDRPDGPIPQTRRAKSGGGGQHLFFAYPRDGLPIPNRVNWMDGIDIRSDGGYVILPDGAHIRGGRYEWMAWNVDLAFAPADVLASIRNNSHGGIGQEPLPPLEDILKGVPEGQRDNTLFREACKLRRRFGDDPEGRKAVEMIILAAAKASNFSREEAMRKIEQAYAQDHSDDGAGSYSGEGWDSAAAAATSEDGFPSLTDYGNVARLYGRIAHDWRYVPQWGWLRFGDLGWQRVEQENIMQECAQVFEIVRDEWRQVNGAKNKKAWDSWVKKSQMVTTMASCAKLASIHPGFLRNVNEFDSDLDSIACRNGIVNLRTGDMRPLTHEELVTKNTGVVYKEDAKSDLWENFLSDITNNNDELREYLQLICGYFLTGLTTLESFYFVLGPSATGKSTFLDAISAAMGSYAAVTQSDTFMHSRNKDAPQQELARLSTARLAAVSEIREGSYFDEALIKQVTGGDKVMGRELYHTAFEYKPQFKVLIATNHEPSTRDDAMMRRLKKIEFTHQVPAEKRNPQLKSLLCDPDGAGEAVFAWMVAGALKFYAQDCRIEDPMFVKQAIKSYLDEHDESNRFIRTMLEAADGAYAPVTAVWNEYDLWCVREGETSFRSRITFIARMRARGMAVVDHNGELSFADITLKEYIGVKQWT